MSARPPQIQTPILACLLLIAGLALASCGSGVIGGIFAGDRGRSGAGTGDARPPRLLLDKTSIPLIEEWEAPLRTLLKVQVSNYLLGQDGAAFVSLAAPSIKLERSASRGQALTQIDIDSRTTTLTYIVELSLVRGLIGYPFRSVDAMVHVDVDGVEIAQPAPLRFVAPGEVIEKRGGAILDGAILVSVDGVSDFELIAEKLFASTSQSDEVELSVLQRNLQVPRRLGNNLNPDALRRVSALDTQYTRDEQTAISTIRGVAPAVRYPGIARVILRDSRSGVAVDARNREQFELPRLLYVPSLRSVGPASVPAEGGVRTRLTGRGLLPAENEGRIRFRFDRVALSIHKGDASTSVPAEAIFSDESSEQVIAFRMPESPDGLPGAATVTLDQKLGPQGEIDYSASLDAGVRAGLRFVRSDPQLGPYVSDLPDEIIDISSGRFRRGSPFGDDCVALRVDSNGTADLQLLRNQGSGLYRSIGARISTSTQNPLRIQTVGLDAVSPDDVVVVSRGAPRTAQHALMESQSHAGSILQPFARFDRVPLVTAGGVADSALADVDGDGRQDLIVLRRDSADRPVEVWTDIEADTVRKAVHGTSGGGNRSVLHAADLDNDGNVDVAFDERGGRRSVIVLYGDGKGAFPKQERIYWANNAALTNADPSLLTSVRVGTGRAQRRDLVIAAEVRISSTQSVAWVGQMVRGATSFLSVSVGSQLLVPTSAHFNLFERVDIDDDAQDELICITRNDFVGAPLHAFDFSFGAPRLLTDGTTDGELLLAARSMDVAEIQISGQSRKALLVNHADLTGTTRRAVLSTFLIGNGRVLPRFPRLPTQNDPLAIVVTDLDGDGRDDDVAWFDKRGLSGLNQAAPGVFEKDAGFDLPMDTSRLLPTTLCAVPRAGGAQPAWLDATGHLIVLDPTTRSVQRSRDLRRFFGARRDASLSTDSRLIAVNAGGDDIQDLVVFLRSAPHNGQATVKLVFLRGRVASSSELPFLEPKLALELDARALAPTVGNVLGHNASRPGVDVAYDIGDRILFASLDLAAKAEDDVFIAQPAITIVASIGVQGASFLDLDEDGRDDVAILVPNQRGVRVWFNRLENSEVGLTGRFISLGGSTLIYPGDAIDMRTADMNGDGRKDLLVLSQVRDGQVLRPVVTAFNNQDRGSLGLAYVYPSRWFGDTRPAAWTVTDLDGNGISDLVFGGRILLGR